MDKEFKDPNNLFRIVFVCAMWLTGFDVKSLATIYLDKPLKAHTLMQTIARANRVCDGKSNGLVVDYIGVVKALRKALADYTAAKGGKTGDDPAPDKTELIEKIHHTISSIDAYMTEHGVSLKSLVEADDFAKLALLQSGANAMCATDEIKNALKFRQESFSVCSNISKRVRFPTKPFTTKMQSAPYTISFSKNARMRISCDFRERGYVYRDVVPLS